MNLTKKQKEEAKAYLKDWWKISIPLEEIEIPEHNERGESYAREILTVSPYYVTAVCRVSFKREYDGELMIEVNVPKANADGYIYLSEE